MRLPRDDRTHQQCKMSELSQEDGTDQKGDSETFVCSCGYKEKLEAFKNRRAKEGAGVSKRDVQKYLKKQQQQNDEPVNNAFAQALAGLKLDK